MTYPTILTETVLPLDCLAPTDKMNMEDCMTLISESVIQALTQVINTTTDIVDKARAEAIKEFLQVLLEFYTIMQTDTMTFQQKLTRLCGSSFNKPFSTSQSSSSSQPCSTSQSSSISQPSTSSSQPYSTFQSSTTPQSFSLSQSSSISQSSSTSQQKSKNNSILAWLSRWKEQKKHAPAHITLNIIIRTINALKILDNQMKKRGASFSVKTSVLSTLIVEFGYLFIASIDVFVLTFNN